MTEQIVVWLVSAVLAVSAMLSLWRMVRGPSIVDRAVANEVLMGVMICALGVEAAVTRHDTTLPILISLSLVGFLASVAVARFVGGDAAPDPRAESPDSLEGAHGFGGAVDGDLASDAAAPGAEPATDASRTESGGEGR